MFTPAFLINGNNITSRIEGLLVNSAASRRRRPSPVGANRIRRPDVVVVQRMRFEVALGASGQLLVEAALLFCRIVQFAERVRELHAVDARSNPSTVSIIGFCFDNGDVSREVAQRWLISCPSHSRSNLCHGFPGWLARFDFVPRSRAMPAAFVVTQVCAQ